MILGRVASGDKFIGTKEGKEHIKRYVQGDCAEMEGAAIAHACWLNRIPFVIIRAISDSADEQANCPMSSLCFWRQSAAVSWWKKYWKSWRKTA